MTVLVWGSRHDAPSLAVVEALGHLGVAVRLLDLREEAEVGPDSDGWRDISAMYVRSSAGAHDDAGRWESSAHLVRLAERLPGRVVNRPSAMSANNSKPWQMARLSRYGLTAPPTLVTNDPAAVDAFAARHGRLVYKSVSGVRSIVREYDARDQERLLRLSACPTQFQALVTGTNHRVHVVGRTVFAAAIRTTAVDYRYAPGEGGSTTMSVARLPQAVRRACVRATAGAGLVVSGIDLIRDLHDQWFCFEMNPSPAFTWFADLTGAPIARAIAQELRAGSRPGEDTTERALQR